MATSSKARLLFIETNVQGKTITRPIVGKVTAKAQSGFNYSVVEEGSARPPAKVSLRRSGDTLIIEQDGSVVSEVENFYGEKAVSYTTDGSPSLSSSNAFITPDSAPIRPLPGGDTLVWASGDGSALLAGLTSGQAAFGVLPVLGLVAGGGGGGGGGGSSPASAPVAGEDPVTSPVRAPVAVASGMGLVTDDGIGGATVTINYFNTSGELVDSLVVVSNDDPTDPGFGSFVVDLAALGYDYTGFITATAVGGRDINGNALNGAVVYQVLVTDSLMGSLAAGDEYQIVLSPLTTLMFQSVVDALGGTLGNIDGIGELLAGATDLDATIGESAAEIVDLFGLGAYGADPLSLFNTASDFDPTRQDIERQVNLLLVTLSALGSGLSDSSMVDDDSMALAMGASSAAALSVLNALVAARDDAALTDDDYVFSAGNASFVQEAVKEFLDNVNDVPEVSALTGSNGLRADGGDLTDATSARIAAAIAGLGALLAQGGENAMLAMAMVAGGDMLPDDRTSLSELFASAFTAATDSDRGEFQGDFEFDPIDESDAPSDVFALESVGGGALDTFDTELAQAIEDIYVQGDFASVVVTSEGAFIDVNRDGVFSCGDVAAIETADFAKLGNASLSENAVTVVFTDGNEDFQATDPLELIDENDRIEIRVQNYDYACGDYGLGDVSISVCADIGTAEFQYILDQGDETREGVSIVVKSKVPGSATLLLGLPDAEADDFASGTVRSIFVDAQSDATENESSTATATAFILFDGEVTGSTFVQATGQCSDANLFLVARDGLTLSTLGALADGDDSIASLMTANCSDSTLDIRGNMLLEAAGDRSTIGGIGGIGGQCSDTAFVGGSGDINFGGLVTLNASGAGSLAKLVIGGLSSSDVEVSFGDVLEVQSSGNEALARLELMNAKVSVTDLRVTASGESSDADFYADSGISGTIDGITLTASGGNNGGESGSHAYADIGGDDEGETLTIKGTLTVTASGTSSEAELHLENVTLDSLAVSVQASDGSSDALFYASNDITGSISSISVTASSYDSYAYASIAGPQGNEERQGFDIFGVSSLSCGDVVIDSGTTVSLNVDGRLLSYTFDEESAARYASGCHDIYGLLSSFAEQAQGLNVNFYQYGSMDSGLYLNFTDFADHNLSALTVTDSCGDPYTFGSGDYFEQDGEAPQGSLTVSGLMEVSASALSAYAQLDLSDATLDGVDISVLAAGQSSYVQNNMDSGITGSINSITVRASDYYSYASADIRGSGSCGDTLTINGDITVTSSGFSSDALLLLENVTLAAVDISLVASGASSEAFFSADSGISGTIKSITVTASGYSAEASAVIQGSGNCGDTLTINGDITVTATDVSAEANLRLENVTLADINISVATSGQSSEAHIQASGITGSISTLSVTSTGGSAEVDFRGVGAQEVQRFTLYQNTDLSALLGSNNIKTIELSFGTQHLTYEISDWQQYDMAYGDFYWIARDLEDLAQEQGIPVYIRDDWRNGFRIVYEGVGPQPFATLTLINSEGDEYTFDASSQYVTVEPGVDADRSALTIDQLIISATGSENSDTDTSAEVNLAYLTLDLGLQDLIVKAEGQSAEAQLNTEGVDVIAMDLLVQEGYAGISYGYDSYADADFDEDSNVTIGGDISVLSYGLNGGADLDVEDSLITITGADLAVKAMGQYGGAYMDLDKAVGYIKSLELLADGEGSRSYATINGDVRFGADFSVSALGRNSRAEVELNGTDISAEVDNAASNITFTNTALVVEALDSRSCSDLSVLDGDGSLASVSALAGFYNARVDVAMDFSGTLAGDITVTASGVRSAANLEMTAGLRAEVRVRVSEGSWRSLGDAIGIQTYNAGDTVVLSVGGTAYSYEVQSEDNFYDVLKGLQAVINDPTDSKAGGFTIWHPELYNNTYGTTTEFNVIWNEQGYLDAAAQDVSFVLHRVESEAVVQVHAVEYDWEPVRSWGEDDEKAYGRGADANRIVLGTDTDVTVAATGSSSKASVNLDYLSGVVDTVTVSATGGANFSSDATSADVWLRFDADTGGHIKEVLIQTGVYGATADDAAVSSRATLRLSQTDFCGDVTVTGDGFATLVIRSDDVKTIDLAGLHSGADDRWGVFTLEFAQADRELATSSFSANNLMTVTGFDVARDAFNSATPYDDTRFNWGEDSDSSNNVFYSEDETQYRTEIRFSSTDVSGDPYEVTTGYATFAELATWASGVLDARGDINIPGYVFGTYGNTGDGYLFYDRSGSGLTDVVKLEGVTSFDAINVAQRQESIYYLSNNGPNSILTQDSAASYKELQYHRQNHYPPHGNYLCGDVDYDLNNSRVQNVSVVAEGTAADLALSELMLLQGELGVNAYAYDGGYYGTNQMNSADANLDISAANGTIDHLYIHARGSSDWQEGQYAFYKAQASAQIVSSSVELRELTLEADFYGTVSADLAGMQGGIQQVTLSVYGEAACADANIAFLDSVSTIEHIDRVDLNASTSGDLSHISLTVSQGIDAIGADGGVVYAKVWNSGDVDFNLTYTGGGRAGEIHLGYVDASGDTNLFNFNSEDAGLVTSTFWNGSVDVTETVNRTFNLVLGADDLDVLSSSQLVEDRLQIWGSDLGTDGGDDTIRFTTALGSTVCDDFLGNDTPVLTLADYLAAANSALNGTTDFYFGVVDTDGAGAAQPSGYLAYDADGAGITMLIEFHGMTDFDQNRLLSYSPAFIP